jgi:hypothetical protein
MPSNKFAMHGTSRDASAGQMQELLGLGAATASQVKRLRRPLKKDLSGISGQVFIKF